jgi:hypothetical protein
MKQNADSLDAIIADARALRKTCQPYWPDYERFKKRIAALVEFGPAYDLAIDLLLEALDL